MAAPRFRLTCRACGYQGVVIGVREAWRCPHGPQDHAVHVAEEPLEIREGLRDLVLSERTGPTRIVHVPADGFP